MHGESFGMSHEARGVVWGESPGTGSLSGGVMRHGESFGVSHQARGVVRGESSGTGSRSG